MSDEHPIERRETGRPWARDKLEASPRTAEDIREDFLAACRTAADYWASNRSPDMGDTRQRLHGLVHSILVMIDGHSGSFPCALDLVARPHPEDRAFHQAEGSDWIADGTVLNGDVLLHELYAGRTPL